jgi:YggT family protein
VSVLYTFLSILELLIIARVILSWVASPVSRNPVVQFIRAVTDPMLDPIRSILPRTGMFDFSPMVLLLVLQLLKGFLPV